MVYKFQKRPTELFLPTTTSNLVAECDSNRIKSPVKPTTNRLPTPIVPRPGSVERKFKLIRKKSSKEKENLVKGHIYETANSSDSNNANNSNKIVKNKTTNKAFTSAKLFDAVLDNDFSLTRKCLISDEMDVNETSPEGTTVLHLASAAGHLECLQLLIECGAKVNSIDNNGRSPLEYAVLYGNFDCAALLIENGADSKVIKNGIH